MIKCEQEHKLEYLLKQEGKDYCAQVMGIPGIIVGGEDVDEIRKEVTHATKRYLDYHDPTHIKIREEKFDSSLRTTSEGAVLSIEKFSVRC
ncbi:MAG: hypothetical protein D9C04_01460 [Nitrosopumilus sp. B06]|nr:MAG: hypothetical protein D9C04_01460 [Nitrosopumilus sp. B06]